MRLFIDLESYPEVTMTQVASVLSPGVEFRCYR